MGLGDGAGYVYGSREAMSVETMVGEIVGTDSAIFIVFSWTKMLLCAWNAVHPPRVPGRALRAAAASAALRQRACWPADLAQAAVQPHPGAPWPPALLTTPRALRLYFGYAVLVFCCWHSVRVIRDAIAKNQAREAREAREAAERAAKRR